MPKGAWGTKHRQLACVPHVWLCEGGGTVLWLGTCQGADLGTREYFCTAWCLREACPQQPPAPAPAEEPFPVHWGVGS